MEISAVIDTMSRNAAITSSTLSANYFTPDVYALTSAFFYPLSKSTLETSSRRGYVNADCTAMKTA